MRLTPLAPAPRSPPPGRRNRRFCSREAGAQRRSSKPLETTPKGTVFRCARSPLQSRLFTPIFSPPLPPALCSRPLKFAVLPPPSTLPAYCNQLSFNFNPQKIASTENNFDAAVTAVKALVIASVFVAFAGKRDRLLARPLRRIENGLRWIEKELRMD